jgi:GMP synthase (glutamine-hydrolysing)
MNVDQMAEFPFLRKSRELMAAAIDRNLPTLGVCLGSQMMARVMGSEVRRAESKNACFSPLELTNEGQRDPIIAPFSDVPVLQFHEDTFPTPDGAELLATSTSSGLVQAFRYGDRAYAVQFHFEVDREILERWCRVIGDNALISEWGISKPDLFAQASRFLAGQREAGILMLERFLEISSDD